MLYFSYDKSYDIVVSDLIFLVREWIFLGNSLEVFYEKYSLVNS